ncbi:MAG: ATP:cob(I)alamin adenosyltransferase [Treponema sp.]|jgi:cob(I)alamin adenosyltransferase|nr:ATP:cob(I)alamin adenosyltransferase [Treponema sp.]
MSAGDNGKTFDLSGQHLSKNSVLIHLIGTLDELNSHLGLVKALLVEKERKDSCQFIEGIQKNLMILMSAVSDPANNVYNFSDDITVLEKEIEKSSKLNEFVLPGKNVLEAQIQIARTVARRAERLFTAASEEKPLCPKAGAYLNRLSGYLFFLSQKET